MQPPPQPARTHAVHRPRPSRRDVGTSCSPSPAPACIALSCSLSFTHPRSRVPSPARTSAHPRPHALAPSHTPSISIFKPDAVILEPPVPTNPLLCRPTLPEADIAIIRRLSVRVKVILVVRRADLLTAAGFGFGIFDHTRAHPVGEPDLGLIVLMANGAHANGASPTPTPLPYELIAPDLFSHSDGVARPAPSRHELVRQYTPTPAQHAQIAPGRWTRTFRWGSLDCLDAAHCDFLQLRGAIFHHMKVRISPASCPRSRLRQIRTACTTAYTSEDTTRA